MSSKTTATSRQSKISRIQAGSTSTVPAIGKEAATQWTFSTRKSVAERLRILKAEFEEQVEIEGMRAGRKWAEQRAADAELQRLASSPGLWWGLNFDDGAEISASELFFFTIRPDQDGDKKAAVTFWKSVTGATEVPDAIFVDAFAETAAEAWELRQE